MKNSSILRIIFVAIILIASFVTVILLFTNNRSSSHPSPSPPHSSPTPHPSPSPPHSSPTPHPSPSPTPHPSPSPTPHPSRVIELYNNSNPGVFVSMLDNPIRQTKSITTDILTKLEDISQNNGLIAFSVLNKNIPLNVYAASTRNHSDIINIGVLFDPQTLLQFIKCSWVTDSGSDRRGCIPTGETNCSCFTPTPQQRQSCQVNNSPGMANCNIKCEDNSGTCGTIRWCSDNGITNAQDFANRYKTDGGFKMCTFKKDNLSTMLEASVEWRKANYNLSVSQFRETEVDAIIPHNKTNQDLINKAIIGFVITDLCNGSSMWSNNGQCNEDIMNETVKQMKVAVKNFNQNQNKQTVLYRINNLKRDEYNGTPNKTWQNNNYKSSFKDFATKILLD
ncbi:MAG: hypothetical protein ACW98D_19770 [Promethearchaeota archaeon]|jgi:hypothetical protein